MAGGELPIQAFPSAAAWWEWLEAEHETSPGLLLQLAKKETGLASVSYPEAVEAALCFGWIDGQRRRIDDRYYTVRFTPRRARSVWSKINREKAETLIASGRMRPAGLREVESARGDGRWDAAYDGQRAATAPDDFTAALDRAPRARAFFETLDSRSRYAILYRLQAAKKPETRRKRIAEFVAMLEEQRTIYPPSRAGERV